MTTDRKIFAYFYFEMNILHWCPFVRLFDTPFQNSYKLFLTTRQKAK